MFDRFGNPIAQPKRCKVTVQKDALVVQTPYNPQFVSLIKGLPANARRFDPVDKIWLIDTQYLGQLRRWILDCYGEDIGTITLPANTSQLETRVCDVWYLGRTKPAGDEFQANGMNAQKEWVFIFPERALREWFEGDTQYVGEATLYGVLGIQRTATDEEIKSAYRRMARQWHPDICKEPNAQEMFIKIKEAYELLSNPTKRARYDAGLVLEESLRSNKYVVWQFVQQIGYRSPLRCGYILAEGQERLGRFFVQKILDWQDIVTDKGILVASWPAGAKEPVWNWI